MTKVGSNKARIKPRERLVFSRVPTVIGIPNLIEIQKKSFEAFLQLDTAPANREFRGFEEVFRDVFPITDLNVNARIEYVGYEVGTWECGCGEYKELAGPGVVCSDCKQEVVYKEKCRLSECRQRGLTYADPIKIMVRMILFDRERIDVTPRVLREIEGKTILEEVKHPQTGKNLISARTPITPEVIEVLQAERVPQVVINSVREVKERSISYWETGWSLLAGIALQSRIGQIDPTSETPEDDLNTIKSFTLDGLGIWGEASYFFLFLGALGVNLNVGIQEGKGKHFAWVGVGISGWY